MLSSSKPAKNSRLPFSFRYFAVYGRRGSTPGRHGVVLSLLPCIVFRGKTLPVFVYGFPKSAKANLNAVELDAYKKLAQVFLSFSDKDIAKALNAGELMEIDTHGQKIQK
jgi:hypothetical protein